MSRLLVFLILLLATALSGTAEASLRAVGPVSLVVVCADGHAVTVALDAEGLPADPGDHRRHCPDCLPLVMGATGGASHDGPARPAILHAVAARPPAFPPRASGDAASSSPRGPPSGDSA